MAEEDDSSKTEEPTPKKLAKAREKGQLAMSQEIKSWLILLGSAIFLFMMAPSMMKDIRVTLVPFISSPHAIPFDFPHLRLMFSNLFLELLIILGPLFGVLVILAIFSSVGQTGLVFSPKKIDFDITKLSPIKGVKKMVSMRSLLEFAKGIFKLSLVAAVGLFLVVPLLDDVAIIPSLDLVQSLERMHELAVLLMVGTVSVMTVIAVLDLFYQKFAHLKEMRMTKQEVKDEQKQSEGDPQIKARIRRLRMERAQRRMMAAIPEADVVITNPTHYAVALEYKIEVMPAPKMVAKGIDTLALRIREVAEANDVPVVENPPLARALYAAVELDEEIPEEHYMAVAEVIGYVMRLKGELQGE
ncbi:MAG: flagellar biosynthesis protein FlhB [Rhodospirillales bacterium]|jgi:flagellar biosynthetic protein FlhB|nr:flagellar biosynthesis protein FlhB [Rhodospirillales bacterium]|tara:strand:+ start:623 stop:1696 length:1074 start_codon:yes stop_codon:yes gene_type:complete